ncbi:enoyl-CoA hydratase/isomerase family protein [Pararobbsia silviterrae]|uniref:Enoyl-CoA hydratase/isomerase family protein n=1 Tax=Pararobbsia silviterrae TaxID=1792498 RepID=A0A494Y500_9BURK|nr:enoyl-CoA hydratase/isomerase family protein [Pararobbsia silviterrae]RKP57786.1 enoyl-CoA hydratase/isomerase family protein [Pararobbsia silviterrae]
MNADEAGAATETALRVEYASHGGVATMTFVAPRANTMTEALIDALLGGIAQYAADATAGVAILTSGGADFSSGASFDELGTLFNSDATRLVCDAIDALSKPVIAVLRGKVFGAGLEIALACDWRVAEPSARLGLPEFAIGLPPGGGATQRLPAIVGVERALDLILSARHLVAAHAYDTHLVDELYDPGVSDDLIQLAKRWAGRRRMRAAAISQRAPAWLADIEARRAGFRARRCTEGVAVCDAVEAGLKEGARAGFDAELRGYLACESAARYRAIRNASRVRASVMTRGLASDRHSGSSQRSVLKSVVMIGDALPAMPASTWAQQTIQVSRYADVESLRAFTRSDPFVVISRAFGQDGVERAIDAVVSRAADATILVVERAEVQPDASPDRVHRSASLSSKRGGLAFKRNARVVDAFAYGHQADSVLQCMRGNEADPFVLERVVAFSDAFGMLCVHGADIAIGPSLIDDWRRAVSVLRATAATPDELDAAMVAAGLATLAITREPTGPSIDARDAQDTSTRAPDVAMHDVLRCALVNAGARMLDNGDVQHPDDIDALLHYGYDVPPESLPFGWGANQFGVVKLHETLRALERAYGAEFTPASMLVRAAARAA